MFKNNNLVMNKDIMEKDIDPNSCVMKEICYFCAHYDDCDHKQYHFDNFSIARPEEVYRRAYKDYEENNLIPNPQDYARTTRAVYSEKLICEYSHALYIYYLQQSKRTTSNEFSKIYNYIYAKGYMRAVNDCVKYGVPKYEKNEDYAKQGKRLAIRREEENLSRKELAEKLNVSATTVYRMEEGFIEISYDMQVKIAKIFGCDTYELFPLD